MGNRYITCDYARYGQTVQSFAFGMDFRQRSNSIKGLSVPDAAKELTGLRVCTEYQLRNVVVDEDGVGGGVVDLLRCTGFVNNSRAR